VPIPTGEALSVAVAVPGDEVVHTTRVGDAVRPFVEQRGEDGARAHTGAVHDLEVVCDVLLGVIAAARLVRDDLRDVVMDIEDAVCLGCHAHTSGGF